MIIIVNVQHYHLIYTSIDITSTFSLEIYNYTNNSIKFCFKKIFSKIWHKQTWTFSNTCTCIYQNTTYKLITVTFHLCHNHCHDITLPWCSHFVICHQQAFDLFVLITFCLLWTFQLILNEKKSWLFNLAKLPYQPCPF